MLGNPYIKPVPKPAQKTNAQQNIKRNAFDTDSATQTLNTRTPMKQEQIWHAQSSVGQDRYKMSALSPLIECDYGVPEMHASMRSNTRQSSLQDLDVYHKHQRVDSHHPSYRQVSGGSLTKSLSETGFARPHQGLSQNNNSNRRRQPTSINTRISQSSNALSSADKNAEPAKNYKVEINNRQTGEPAVRSPLKKLFGDGGLLGWSASATSEAPDPRYKRSGLSSFTRKVKDKAHDLKRDVQERMPGVNLSRQNSTASIGTFPISLSPYAQGDFYMQLELLLNVETNRFLMKQLQFGHISVESVKQIVNTWAHKGRPQVIGFRYDLATQRDLVELNMETLGFNGVSGLDRVRLISILTTWKTLAREISIRTFCQPDSVVKKHLHDAEKVLELIDAEAESMTAFQDVRARVLGEIYSAGKRNREDGSKNGRTESPSKS